MTVGDEAKDTMSNAPSTLSQHATETEDDPANPLTYAESAAKVLTKPFQFAGFWSAVVLPFVYAPILLGGVAAGQRTTFVGLLALHAVTLLAGHGYRND